MPSTNAGCYRFRLVEEHSLHISLGGAVNHLRQPGYTCDQKFRSSGSSLTDKRF